MTDTTPTWTTTTEINPALTARAMGAAVFDSDAHALSIVSGSNASESTFGLVSLRTAAGASVWEDTAASATYSLYFMGHTAGAADSDECAALVCQSVTNQTFQLQLRRYTTASATPSWTWTSGVGTSPDALQFDVGYTADGSRCVVFDGCTAFGQNNLHGFSSSGTPDWTVNAGSGSAGVGFDLARDGGRCIVGTLSTARVFSVTSGAVLFTLPPKFVRTSVAISPNGEWAAQSWTIQGVGLGAELYNIAGGAPVVVHSWVIPNDSWENIGSKVKALAVSDDAASVAVGWGARRYPASGSPALAMGLTWYDGVTGQVETQYVHAGAYFSGNLDASAYVVRLSDDGLRCAVGSLGSHDGRIPEVLGFRRGYQVPDLTYSARHSCDHLGLSRDGVHILAAQRRTHWSGGGGGTPASTPGLAWFDQAWAARR